MTIEPASDGMRTKNSASSTKRVKRLGITGVAVGVLSVLACELPLVLALVGLGGMSSVASAFSLPPIAERIGIVIGALGLFLILAVLIYRIFSKVRQ